MAEATWWTTGAKKAQEARKKMQSMYRPEFWMKDGETANIIFLDAEPFNIYQHQVKIRGRIKKYTCLGPGGRCPLCQVSDPRFLSVYRIIDMRTYESKDGKKHTNTEKYYEAGARVAPQLERLNDKGKLHLKMLEITRTGATTDTVYSFIYEGKPTIAVPQSKLKFQVDYKPKTEEELITVASVLGGDEDDAPPPAREPRKPRDYHSEDEENTEAESNGAADGGEEPTQPTEEDDQGAEEQQEEPAAEEPPPPVRRRRLK